MLGLPAIRLAPLTVMAEAAVIARMKKRQEAEGAEGTEGDGMFSSSDEESMRQRKYSHYQVSISGLARRVVWPALQYLASLHSLSCQQC